jgi:hypothetical protein
MGSANVPVPNQSMVLPSSLCVEQAGSRHRGGVCVAGTRIDDEHFGPSQLAPPLWCYRELCYTFPGPRRHDLALLYPRYRIRCPSRCHEPQAARLSGIAVRAGPAGILT